ncbi:MAG TPA: hypothetical protein VF787_08175 [Thermoanaerobaculia bacterium]
MDLFTNTVDDSKECYLICDAARFNGDFIPIFLFEGFHLYKIKVFRRQGLDVTREIIRQTLAEERIPYSHTLIDENGVGGGLIDDLKGVKGFVAKAVPMEPKLKAQDSPKEQYENLKAQCTYLLAEAVNRHRVAVALDQVELPPNMTITQVQGDARRRLGADEAEGCGQEREAEDRPKGRGEGAAGAITGLWAHDDDADVLRVEAVRLKFRAAAYHGPRPAVLPAIRRLSGPQLRKNSCFSQTNMHKNLTR